MGTMLFITDTHHIRYKFNFPINHVFIECNHTDGLVDKSVENGVIPYKVGVRTKATHMSLERCINCLNACDLSKTKNIVLIHISDNNGNSNMFKNKVEMATGKPVYVATKGLVLDLL